ncbi:MAG: iron-sulfur cluster assembly scaffold protein [Candidatus Acidiferrales bacterium]
MKVRIFVDILKVMFSEIVLRHFRDPHNVGELDLPNAVVEVSNPVCGDVMRLSIALDEGRISAARFKTQGCVASIAAGSVLTDMLVGRSAAEAQRISAEEISAALGGLPPASFHAAQLCTAALAALGARPY